MSHRNRARWPDPALLAILALSFALGAFHMSWGLPNGNASWAADAPGPLTVLQVCWKSVGSFNSGWFWFKYPLGYPLLLAIAYSPYLAWLRLSGGWQGFSTHYPYGLADPEGTLYALALVGRCVNLLLIVGTVALTFGIARRLIGRGGALLATWFVATAYPLVYYAHTTNQDAAYLFWLTAALWAALVAGREGKRRSFLLLGFAAGMAMATKEQGFAWLMALPLLLAVAASEREPGWHSWSRRVRDVIWTPNVASGLAASVVTYAVASNAILNPLGVWNRLQDLTGHPVPGFSARLTPIEFSFFKGIAKELFYVRELSDVVASSLGSSLALVALAGLAYLILDKRRAALWLCLPAALYYLLSLRTHDVLTLRYTLPLLPVLAIAAGAGCTAVWRRNPRWGMVLAAGLALVSLARAFELDALLIRDPRYAAEEWMAQNAAPASRIEVYQKPVYLPRLSAFSVDEIPMKHRTIDGVLARNPDFLVISSAGFKRVTHFWNPDWTTTGSLLVKDEQAAAFLEALEVGALPYHVVASFAAPKPVLLRSRITSVAPSIWIYGRES